MVTSDERLWQLLGTLQADSTNIKDDVKALRGEVTALKIQLSAIADSQAVASGGSALARFLLPIFISVVLAVAAGMLTVWVKLHA